MADLPLSFLDAREQKLIENARVAWGQGNAGYVLAVTEPILKEHPDCLPVRRLVHAARLKQHTAKNILLTKTMSALSLTSLVFGGGAKSAIGRFERAERLVAANPTNAFALKRQAEAALEMDWVQTAVFLREAVQTLTPKDQRNLLALGEAWMAAGRPDQTLLITDAILQERPVDGDAQNLMRKASIAQTVNRGNWEQAGDFRGKLNPPPNTKG